MDRKLKLGFFLLVLFGIVAISLVLLFQDRVIVLSPKGLVGQKESELLLIATYIMLFVLVPVFLLTFFISWKYRASNKRAEYKPEWDNSHVAEAVWWGIPCAIILVLSVITWKSCHELDPFKPLESNAKPVRVQVVALQWKWLFLYPDQNVASLNELHIPVDVPINFEITADAPMNSFWIPELGGQIYAMSGMVSKLHLIANEPDTYRGFSANLSGAGFAGMTFMAKATSEDEFNSWVTAAQGAETLDETVYLDLVKPSEYVSPKDYALASSDLFNQIVMKYMMPHKGEHASRD